MSNRPRRPDSTRRRKVFYGRRKGPSLSAPQKALLENNLPPLKIELPRQGAGKLHLENLFAKDLPEVWLEIGFGKGEHLAWQAQHYGDVGFLGAEPYVNGVVGLLARIDEASLSNIRIYPDEASALLDALPTGSLGRVFLLHPDPWPKKRHEKRRFLSHANLDRLSAAMKPGAELRIGSDHQGYLTWARKQLLTRADFQRCSKLGPLEAAPGGMADWPETRYEAKAARQGHAVTKLTYLRL